MTKQIVFFGKRTRDLNRDGMSFQVEIDGKKTSCYISREALEDHYGANQGKTVEKAFDDNQFIIEDVARNIINNNLVDTQGEYLITSQAILN